MRSDPKQPAPVATTMSFKFEAVPRCSNAEARRKWSEAVFTAFCTGADLAFVYCISLAHLGGTSVLQSQDLFKSNLKTFLFPEL